MYGTVAKFKVKPGAGEKLRAVMGEAPARAGHIATYVFELDKDPNTQMVCTVFESEEAYKKFADDPNQDKRFQAMRELITADPEWNDGKIVHHDVSVTAGR